MFHPLVEPGIWEHFTRSMHSGYLKNHNRYEIYIHRMLCVLYILPFETTRTYSNNKQYLEVLLITECCFKAG